MLRWFVLLVFSALCVAPSLAQNCPVFPGKPANSAQNMFSEQQEVWLGDAEADYIEHFFKLVPPPAGDDYLTTVGAKLLAVLPPTQIHYRFRIYESQELNAFGIAGGRIYISSKMISALHSEDELAALLAHEIGHIATHQQAQEITALFRKNGIESVGDQRDIERKFRQLVAMPNPKQVSTSEETGQDIADQVAIYATVKAGYNPKAFAEMFDRITGNKGRSGNRVMDFLGYTNEASRRYRAGVAMANAVPSACLGKSMADPAQFAAWKRHVAERDLEANVESGSDLSMIKLASPLGSDLSVLRFSPDGKRILAVDSSTVTVVQRSPLKLLFQIPATYIYDAWFTPDSSAVTFVNATLRVEKWDIASQKRVALYEPSLSETCDSIFLAPDGRSVVCGSESSAGGHFSIGLTLLNTEDSSILWQNLDFAPVTGGLEYGAFYKLARAADENSALTYAQSPDGRILLLGALDHTVGFDLESRTVIDLPHDIKTIGYSHFAFVGSDKLIVENGEHPDDSSVLAYPSGKVLRKLKLGTQNLIEITKGNAVVLRPIKGAAAGLLNLDSNKLTASSSSMAMDLYDSTLLRQTPTGNIQLDDLARQGGTPEVLEIPRRRLGRVEASAFSPDGQYLALSTSSRSAVWDLKNNVRIALMRPFAEAYFTSNNQLYVDFFKYQEAKRAIGLLDLTTKKGSDTGFNPNEHTDQMWDTLTEWKKSGNGGTLEVRSVTDNHVLWSRAFPDGLASWSTQESDPNMLLWWYLDSPGARREMRDHPELKARGDAIQNKREGVVIEEVNRDTGAFVRAGVIDHKEAEEGIYKQVSRTISPMADYLTVQGTNGITNVYHLPEGLETTEFFGAVYESDPAHHLLVAVNQGNALRVLDGATGDTLLTRDFASPVRLVRFKPNTTDLWVLTADENLHTLHVDPVRGN